MSTVQKNQHYVWRHYLLAWAQDEQVWCVRAPDTKAFSSNVKNIGSSRYFYRVAELTGADFVYLEHLISRATDPRLQELNRGWVENFQMSFTLRRLLDGGGALDPAKVAQLEEALDEIAKTVSERHHGALEERAKPILAQLRRGDATFYEDLHQSLTFIDFLAHQYFRTAKMRKAVRRLPAPAPFDLDRTWPIESYIYATNVASSLVGQRRDYRITFLENATPIPFVAGDQPVINLHGQDDAELCFYYPLSPAIALVYHAEPERFPKDRVALSRFEVEAYNAKLYSRSDNQMYSNDRAYLEDLVRMPKDEEAF